MPTYCLSLVCPSLQLRHDPSPTMIQGANNGDDDNKCKELLCSKQVYLCSFFFISFMHRLAHDMNIFCRMSFIQTDAYHTMLVSFEPKRRQPHHLCIHQVKTTTTIIQSFNCDLHSLERRIRSMSLRKQMVATTKFVPRHSFLCIFYPRQSHLRSNIFSRWTSVLLNSFCFLFRTMTTRPTPTANDCVKSSQTSQKIINQDVQAMLDFNSD